jgi:amino acid transporter
MQSSSPGVVIANTNSVGASLVVWIAAGLLAWTGASSYAELGTAIPLNGGPQVGLFECAHIMSTLFRIQAYLAYAYGPLASYLFAWTAISALKPGGNAVIALIFAEYTNRIFWHTTKSDISPDNVPQWAIKLTAVAAIIIVTGLCVSARNVAARAAVIFTTVKVSPLLNDHNVTSY